MKIGVFGTGMVGETIATKLIGLGHDVMMGSRTADNPKAATWVAGHGAHAHQGTFADAASYGELLFNCTSGMHTLTALESAGEERLGSKVLIDISNPLDFSKGMPPTLFVSNDDSLGEQIQRTFPNLRVVKTLNTTNCEIMVDASKVSGDHTVFVSGNDPSAKAQVQEILSGWFGWKDVIDLGDITTARGTESLLPLWIRLYSSFGHANFNFKVVR